MMMKIGVVMGEVGKHGDKREKGGRRKGGILTLVFLRSLGEKAAKKGFLLEILRGYNS